jgi:hypothetical protein
VILAVNPLHLPLCITKPARGAALQYLWKKSLPTELSIYYIVDTSIC